MVVSSGSSFLAVLLLVTLFERGANATATLLDEWPSESILETISASRATSIPFVPAKKSKTISNGGFPTESSDSKSVFTMSEPSTFRFQRKSGQFVKMPQWAPYGTPGSLSTVSRGRPVSSPVFSFQFRSSRPDGTLLYLDDGGPHDYIELTLKGATLEVKFKFGGDRKQTLSAGKNFDDRRWHSVEMEVTGIRVSLSVDGKSQTASAQSFTASPMTPRSFCYLGGIPSTFLPTDLSQPEVPHNPGLLGEIRRYAIDGQYQRPLDKYLVVEEAGSDHCYVEVNPCKNNGTCYELNHGPACDCSESRFDGKHCAERYAEAAATFLGNEWFEYDLSSSPISSFTDNITLYFKTKQSNGLLLHTGKSADFVNLSIKNGGISLVVNLGSGAYEVLLKPTVGSFNDNEWHFLQVYRELKRVNLTVDKAETTSGFTQEDFTQLTLDNVFYIGGSPSNANLPGSPAASNFMGCLKEVTYTNPDKTYQFSRMANRRNSRIRVRGNVVHQCNDVEISGPITFKTSDSFLKLPSWKSPQAEDMKLEFMTSEPHGLLLYGAGRTTLDFIALELFEGYLFFLINLGSGVKKTRIAYDQPLNDGNWHSIKVQRDQNRLNLVLDNVQRMESSVMGPSKTLDLEGPLYLAGTDFNALDNSRRVLKGLWTASLKYGFVGCIRNVFIDKGAIDIETLAKNSLSDPTDIAPECENLGQSACESGPCKNGGKCREGWNRFVCDCSATAFAGRTCELAVSTVAFNGSQSLRFPSVNTKRTQAEELSFRFKTPLSYGLLFTTTSVDTADRLTVTLVKGGRVKVTVDIDCAKKNCTAPRQGPVTVLQGQGLNDKTWHTARMRRFGRRLSLEVDGKIKGGQLPAGHYELQFDTIHLGRVTGSVSQNAKPYTDPPFAGLIQNLVFNNEPLIDRCFNRKMTKVSCVFDGKWGETDIVSNSITFGNKNSYVSIGTLDAYSSMMLFFTLRTTVSDGLILYNDGREGDYIAVELVGGCIHYIYNLGNGAQVISTPVHRSVNDDQWHEIRIVRDTFNKHMLSLDGFQVTQQGVTLNTNLDLQGSLYIGGVRQDMYFNNLPDRVESRFGFQGCLGTFDFNGLSPQLFGNDRLQMGGNVSRGCSGPAQACTPDPCLNGGVCRQEWSSFTCDCSMTSYAGRRCETHISQMSGGQSYRFNEGIIVYKWPTATFPSSRMDKLSLGFSTTERNCVLMKISSLEKSTMDDYMQLEIENRRLTLRFNVGNKEIVLREPMGVADGQYHFVFIRRVWMNATMRVDNWPERKVAPQGKRKRFDLAATSIPLSARSALNEWLRRKETKNTVFNSQSTIQVGGLLRSDDSPSPARSGLSRLAMNPNSNVVRPFKGLMSGFIFNGIDVFTLARSGSEQISVVGGVELVDDAPIFPTPDLPFPTTVATMTTFTTSSTQKRSEKNISKGSECDEELCSEEQGKKMDDTMQGDDQTSQVTPGVEVPPLATVSIAITTSRSVVKNSPVIMSATVVESSEGNGTNINGSDNLRSGDNRISVDGSSDVTTGFFGKFINGTTAMVGGIIGAAVISILCLLFAMYKYKHRDDHAHRVDKSTPKLNGHSNGHAGSMARKKKGSVKSAGKGARGREVDKEYYV